MHLTHLMTSQMMNKQFFVSAFVIIPLLQKNNLGTAKFNPVKKFVLRSSAKKIVLRSSAKKIVLRASAKKFVLRASAKKFVLRSSAKKFVSRSSAKLNPREMSKFRGLLEPRNLIPAKFNPLKVCHCAVCLFVKSKCDSS